MKALVKKIKLRKVRLKVKLVMQVLRIVQFLNKKVFPKQFKLTLAKFQPPSWVKMEKIFPKQFKLAKAKFQPPWVIRFLLLLQFVLLHWILVTIRHQWKIYAARGSSMMERESMSNLAWDTNILFYAIPLIPEKKIW